ncbi:hypothetical protein QUF61_10910 [Candidatus Venteria ishoeyi]|uniref:hypothetical protein n=1 Tax=Candidatus Venteria ishoeyi TaxID=1899563 RepID=UPI0025A5D95E|nr:hypothetical protein [Candidatus Venteria ishoeyi]MDM8546993.1 hypothetical protein [Candidatus Venteria ishoeyi]
MNYQHNIRNSPLKFVLRKISMQLVRKWLECAKYKYGSNTIADFDFDEIEVENDFIRHLSNAIESLINYKSREKKSIPGWSFGYICGHVQGALNVTWSNLYLLEPSKEFENLMKLKTVIELLRIDNDFSQKIEIIYSYFITHRNRGIIAKEALPDNVISLIETGKLKNINKGITRKEFDEYFENLFMTNYMSLLQSYDYMCCPDLTEYLDENEMINLVGKVHFS